MNKILLDTSALLAYLFEESGEEVVAPVLNEGLGLISTVNFAELVSKLVDKEMPISTVRETVDSLELEIIVFSTEHAFIAGRLRSVSKQYGLSLGDRACLATASIENLPVLTADKIWLEIENQTNIEIKTIR